MAEVKDKLVTVESLDYVYDALMAKIQEEIATLEAKLVDGNEVSY